MKRCRNYESEFDAIRQVATKLGVSAEPLRRWRRSSEVDLGQRPRDDVRVGLTQLTVLPSQPHDVLAGAAGDTVTVARVDLRLAHPAAQRLY